MRRFTRFSGGVHPTSDRLRSAVLRCLLFLWILPGAAAQPRVVRTQRIKLPVIAGSDLRFTRFSPADGLSQIRVSDIVQDDQGFLWFATQYGLNRYDGYNFRVLIHDLRNANSLSGVYIYGLFKDRNGILWIGCDQFLNRFEPATETFTRYPIPFVNHISQDSAGVLWLATGRGLYSLDPSTGQIRAFTHSDNDPSSLSSNAVKSSGEDREGNFWVANSEGLDEFNRETGKVTLHVPLREPLHEFYFHEDRFGVFWIYHLSGDGLAVFDRKTNTLTQYSFHERAPLSTAMTGVKSLLEDSTGNIWIGTQGSGLLKFDREHRSFVAYRHDLANPESLAEDSVNCLFEDREGNIWAGLGAQGINRFSWKSMPFQKISYDSLHPYSKGESIVNAITGGTPGRLWISTREALNRIDLDTGQRTSYRIDDVVHLTEDLSGVLWAGTFNHGLSRLDSRTGTFKTYRHNPSDAFSLSSDIAIRILADHKGALWVATWDGLDRFDPATERFTTYRLDPNVKDMFYLELVEDSQGILWLGTTSSGVHRFDPATGQFTVYEHQGDRPGSLSDNRVNSVYFDHTGTMWVGTQNGLNRFNPATSTFIAFTQRDGLPGNVISCILEDPLGDLWMSTNNGISKFSPETRTFKNYSTADGLPGPDLTGLGACYKDARGEMFFGGFSGGTAFYPNKVVDNPYTPPVVLTDFRLFGNPVDIGDHSPLHRAISYTDRLTLSSKQNIFSFAFSALSYSNPAANRYRYKLQGLDREWNQVGSDRRLATFTTLPAGNYTLRVQGATSNGPWSEPGVTLRVEVLPPLWSTWLFRAISATLFLFLVLAAYYRHLRQIAWQFDMRLEERVSERTRIARELHDTLLQGFHGLMFQFQAARNMLPQRPQEAMDVLDSAIGATEQAISEGRSAIQQLRSEQVDNGDLAQWLTKISEELARSQQTNGDSPTFRLTVEGEQRSLSPLPRTEVYRITGEILQNAFRHARAHHIEAEIRYDQRLLRVRIRDDGRGIDPQILRAGGSAGHWGLRGARERAQQIGARLNFWSEAGAGTEVELSVPAAVAYEKSQNK